MQRLTPLKLVLGSGALVGAGSAVALSRGEGEAHPLSMSGTTAVAGIAAMALGSVFTFGNPIGKALIWGGLGVASLGAGGAVGSALGAVLPR